MFLLLDTAIGYYIVFIDLNTIESPYSKFGLKWMAQRCEPQQWSVQCLMYIIQIIVS